MGRISILIILSLASFQTGHAEVLVTKAVIVEPEFKQAATKYGLHPMVFKAVLKVESDYNHKAVNASTLDFGIGQINYKTAEAYNIDISRLTKDRAYSIDRAAFVLSTFQSKFKRKEPATWVCRYNIGWQKLEGKAGSRCAEYLRKIKLAMGGM